MSDREEFVLTKVHVELLRRANVSWDGMEFGAPQINPKRPYGNGDVIADIAKILGVPWDPEGYDRVTADDLRQIHEETEQALAILLQHADVVLGRYTRPNAWTREWAYLDCPTCGGGTWVTEPQHGCNGNERICPQVCPVPVQVPCPDCSSAAEPNDEEAPF
jgi:hypothetical protein